jgi:hypothetical protein
LIDLRGRLDDARIRRRISRFKIGRLQPHLYRGVM